MWTVEYGNNEENLEIMFLKGTDSENLATVDALALINDIVIVYREGEYVGWRI